MRSVDSGQLAVGSGELPSNWISIELSKAVIYSKGKKPKTLSSTEGVGFIPYIDIKAFEKGIIDEYADIKSSKVIDENDILVVWDGARFGLTGMGVSGAAGSTLMVLKSVLCYPKYIYSFINRYYSYINLKPKGTGTPHVNPDIFWNLPFPIAPLNEQKRIVAKLDAIMPRIEAVKARLDKVPGILKRFRQSVLTAAVTGKLTEQWREEHPEVGEWEETRLSDLSKLITKGASPTWQGINYVENPEVLFVTSENVYTRELKLEKKKYVEFAFNQKQQRSILRKGDLLTNIVGASIGRTAVYDLDLLANVNQAVALIRLNIHKEIPFYLHYLNCPEYLNKLNKEKVDVARANISLTDLNEMLVPHPPLVEQYEIVRQVDKLFALADKVEVHYQKAKARVDKLSQSVLAKAFRGELVPQDPNDEPAEKLLERILEEKAKMEAELKGTRKRGSKK